MSKNLEIHGLRGLLAFALFAFHVAHSGLPRSEAVWSLSLDWWLHSMRHGVEVFFAISGFVILRSFKGPDQVGAFFVNRISRIYPVLWVTVLTIVALLPFSSRHDDITLTAPEVVANMLALVPVLPGRVIHPASWSISYEFAFYALFVLYAIVHRVKGHAWALGTVLVVAAFAIGHHTRALAFLTGLWFAAHPPGQGWRRVPLSPAAWFIGALASLHLAHGHFEMWDALHPADSPEHPELALGLYLLGHALLALGFAKTLMGQGGFCHFLRWPAVQWLGTISYSFYLWQTIVMAITKAAMHKLGLVELAGTWSQLLFFVLALPPTLLVSHWSQVCLEARVTALIRRRWMQAA